MLIVLQIGLAIFQDLVPVIAQQNVDVCVSIPDSTYVLDPLSCDNFYICSNGVGLLAPCPGGDFFNPVNQACMSPNLVECHLFATTTVANSVGPTRDPNVEDGIFCPATDNPQSMQFIASRIDCGRYYICYYGQPIPMYCLEGFYWNQVARMCDYPINANCAVSVPNFFWPSLCDR